MLKPVVSLMNDKGGPQRRSKKKAEGTRSPNGLKDQGRRKNENVEKRVVKNKMEDRWLKTKGQGSRSKVDKGRKKVEGRWAEGSCAI